MFLVVTATEHEMGPIAERLTGIAGWLPLVAGVGCLETAVTLSRYLAGCRSPLAGIINAGVAGAFVGAGPGLLDLCLAEEESLAEVGIWTEEGIQDFDTIQVPVHFDLHGPLLDKARTILAAHGTKVWSGPFVSVSAVSGTQRRGESLRQRFHALCENMEGAAVARVAREFDLPCLELRAVSNMVLDRDLDTWQLAAATRQCAEALALLLPGLQV